MRAPQGDPVGSYGAYPPQDDYGYRPARLTEYLEGLLLPAARDAEQQPLQPAVGVHSPRMRCRAPRGVHGRDKVCRKRRSGRNGTR